MDAYPLVERFISEGGYRLYPDSIVVPKRNEEWFKNKDSTSLEQLRLGILPNQYTTMEPKVAKVDFCIIEPRQSSSLLLSDTILIYPSSGIKGYPTSYEFTPQTSRGKKKEPIPGQ